MQVKITFRFMHNNKCCLYFVISSVLLSLLCIHVSACFFVWRCKWGISNLNLKNSSPERGSKYYHICILNTQKLTKLQNRWNLVIPVEIWSISMQFLKKNFSLIIFCHLKSWQRWSCLYMHFDISTAVSWLLSWRSNDDIVSWFGHCVCPFSHKICFPFRLVTHILYTLETVNSYRTKNDIKIPEKPESNSCRASFLQILNVVINC